MDPRPLAVVALLVVFAARLFWLELASTSVGVDYYQFWLVGRVLAEGEAGNVYSPEGRARLAERGQALAARDPDSRRLAMAVGFRTSVETFSTPLLYTVVGSLGTADYDVDLRRFHALGLACLLLGTALLARLAGFDWLLTGLALVALLLCSDPLASDARVANVNAVQLAGVAAYLYLRRGTPSQAREAGAGALLALLVLFKPTLGLGALFLAFGWIADRRWQTLRVQGVAVVATSAIAIAASSARFGSGRAWLDWLASLSGLERDADVSVGIGNFSIARAASELGAPDLSGLLLIALTLAMALVTWRGSRRSEAAPRPNDRNFLALALGCAASVVALRLAWLHYYLLLVPLILFLVGPSAAHGVRLAAIGLATACVLGAPLRVVLPDAGTNAQALAYMAGALVLVGLGLAEVARGARRA